MYIVFGLVTSYLSVPVQYVAIETIGVGESLRPSTFTDTHNTMLFRMQNAALHKADISNTETNAILLLTDYSLASLSVPISLEPLIHTDRVHVSIIKEINALKCTVASG